MIDLDRVASSQSLQDAIFEFRDILRPFGVRDVFYGYMLEVKGHIKHDVCTAVTFPEEIMDLYRQGGGLSNDPVAADAATPKVYYQHDFRNLVQQNHGMMLAHNQFLQGLLDAGYTTAWCYNLHAVEKTGFAAATLYQDLEGCPPIDPEAMLPLLHAFQKIVIEQGFLASLFELSSRELSTLRKTASGKTASDIAASEGVSSRTIELRLKRTRAVLKARTTAEAIFKASNYGLLRRDFL